MAKTDPQSYEVAEYSDPELDTATAFKVINQFFVDQDRGPVKNAVWCKWSGDKLKIHYHSYEMHLDHQGRLDQVKEEGRQILNGVVTALKKYFKEHTGKALKLAEDKELADYTTEKVSLNQRFYFKTWRMFTVSF